MRKLILCMSVVSVLVLIQKIASAKSSGNNATIVASSSDVDTYIEQVYQQIDFGKKSKLSPEVFEKAFRGYLNLRNAGKLNTGKELITICDFTQSSAKPRLWIIDLKARKVVMNDYVAHGQGSGDEFAKSFSNQDNSHQSSLGFYVTGETYVGEHGTSLRLHGMDNGFNSAAYERAIVVHGADYVSPQFIASQKRLGRSWGCPAVASSIAPKVINAIKDGTCLFIYYPQKSYLANAYWMNKKVERLPEDNLIRDMLTPSDLMAQSKPAPVYIYTPETEYLNPACKVSMEYLAAYVKEEIRSAAALSEDSNTVDEQALALNLSFIHGILP